MTFSGYPRVLDDLFKGAGQWYALLFAMYEGRHDAIIIDVVARTAGDVIKIAAAIMQFDHCLEIFQSHQKRGVVGIANRHADDEIVTAGAADSFDDRQRQAAAIFERATPWVVTLV